MDISQVSYKRGLLSTVKQARRIHARKLRAPRIPQAVLDAFEHEGLLEIESPLGNPAWGQPIEYDELVVDHAGGRKTIKVFNRGITLFYASNDSVQRAHRILCTLQDALKSPG